MGRQLSARWACRTEPVPRESGVEDQRAGREAECPPDSSGPWAVGHHIPDVYYRSVSAEEDAGAGDDAGAGGPCVDDVDLELAGE